MTRSQKFLTVAVWCALVATVVGMLALGPLRRPPQGPQAMGVLPGFALIDQEERPTTDRDLLGKVWIADFIFTRCGGPCPKMTAKLAGLQKQIPDARVGMLSFTVDPDHDTPGVLKQYAASHGADPARWRFVTGPAESVRRVATGLKVASGAPGSKLIAHSTYFILIDAKGQVRGYYRGQDPDPEPMRKLVADAKLLAAQAGKP